MAFICITCGTQNFESLLAGYEHITVQCQNCGNFSAKVYKKWEWFTVCFIPLIPFSLKPYHEVYCPTVCRFSQDIKFRPDVQQQMDGAAQPIPLQNGPPQGWQGGQPPGGGGGGAQPMVYK